MAEFLLIHRDGDEMLVPVANIAAVTPCGADSQHKSTIYLLRGDLLYVRCDEPVSALAAILRGEVAE